MTRLRRVYANRLVRYGTTIALLCLVAYKVNFRALVDAASSANPVYLGLALLLTVPFVVLKAVRWHRLLLAANVHASFGEAMLSLLGGMGLGLVTPVRIGELARVAYLRDPQKLKIGGLVMIDKSLDVVVLTGLSVAGAWTLVGPWAGLLFFGVTLTGLAVVLHPAPLSSALHRLSSRLPMRLKMERIWSSLESLSPRSTVEFLFWTLLSFAVVLLQFGVLLLDWRAWSFDVVFLTFPIVILTNAVPVTIGGLGVREGAAVVLLAHFGVSSSHAFLAALLMFAMNTALPGLVGAFVLPLASRSPTRAARMPDPP